MPSERRLHPLSIFFNIGKRMTAMLLPLVVVLAGRGSNEDWWSVYALGLLLPYAVFVVAEYLSFRYRYDAGELVIRDGVFFRNQRHVPYDRIQNIDAVQNVLHRVAGVVEVKIQTAGGKEPEATLSVLSLTDLEEMRRKVFGTAHQREASGGEASSAPVPAAHRTLLRLSPRELVLYALIENRGFVVIAAALGLLSEFSYTANFVERIVGEEAGRGFFRRAARVLFVDGRVSVDMMVYGLAALVAFLLLTRLFSIVWAQVRLQGYSVVQVGEDLRAEYGLFTRVTATVPIRRIQAVTIRDTPLHRLLGRAAISVATAGGGSSDREKAAQHREWIAPIVRRDDIPAFVAALLPGTDLSAFVWQPVHPRALRRAVTRGMIGTTILTTIAALVLGADGLWLFPVLAIWSVIRARRLVRYLAWTITPDVVAARRGAFIRVLSIAPLARIQVVARLESPFDRRTTMGHVRADTAGGGHRIDVPYLPVDTASTLYGQLAAAAAHTEFRW
jgi:putative membrane protein